MDANNSAATIPRIRMGCYFFHRLSFCSYATLIFECSRAWLRYRRGGGERERIRRRQRVQFYSALELASICPIFSATYLLVTTKILKPADSVGLFLLWTLLLKLLLFAARGSRGSPRSCRLCRDQWGQIKTCKSWRISLKTSPLQPQSAWWAMSTVWSMSSAITSSSSLPRTASSKWRWATERLRRAESLYVSQDRAYYLKETRQNSSPVSSGFDPTSYAPTRKGIGPWTGALQTDRHSLWRDSGSGIERRAGKYILFGISSNTKTSRMEKSRRRCFTHLLLPYTPISSLVMQVSFCVLFVDGKFIFLMHTLSVA